MRTSSARGTRGVSKVSLLVSAAAAVMLSACSSSLERFSSNVSDDDPVYTASVPKAKADDTVETAQADEGISSRPLAKAPVAKRKYSYTQTAEAPVYKSPTYKKPVNDTVDAPDVVESAVPANDAGQTLKPIRNGRVTVSQGMTLYSIARANGVSVGDLAAANNLDAPYGVKVGQSLKIPGKPGAKTPVMAEAQADEEAPAAAPNQLRYKKQTTAAASDDIAPVKTKDKSSVHTVAGGETLFSLGRKYGVSPFAIADANKLPHATNLKVGQPLKIPGAGAKVYAQSEPAEETAAPAKKPKKAQDSIAMEEDAAPAAEDIPAPKKQKTAEASSGEPGLPGFRWPVRGKVISPYGAKPNGLRNEGVNIAVPEGTSVRAAESGVVAYAGSELKGYGNLVLVRHEGGWVTAYAHAKELFVKRGDTVKRGDVIAKAGQTGSVSSPQLHFEVRKGATAMDPMKFLNSATAAN
jgi:murein DD-endopeptidase MepM/ murein hydrolase activator NlpD